MVTKDMWKPWMELVTKLLEDEEKYEDFIQVWKRKEEFKKVELICAALAAAQVMVEYDSHMAGRSVALCFLHDMDCKKCVANKLHSYVYDCSFKLSDKKGLKVSKKLYAKLFKKYYKTKSNKKGKGNG